MSINKDKSPTLTATHDGAPAVCYWDGGQTVGTLTANNAGGAQRMPDKNHFQCIIEQVDSRGGYSVQHRKRTSPRCHESEQGSMQDSKLHGRSDESPHPKVIGTLMASGYQKQGVQEAMNDMYVVEKLNED